MAGLGKYHMGGYGRIGVYRVKGVTLVTFNQHIKDVMALLRIE